MKRLAYAVSAFARELAGLFAPLSVWGFSLLGVFCLSSAGLRLIVSTVAASPYLGFIPIANWVACTIELILGLLCLAAALGTTLPEERPTI